MNKYYGQFDPSVDRFIFERYFPGHGIKGTCVECGAFDGLTECSCKFFEETMGWKGYNFEPVPWIYDQLCRNRPDSTNLNFALSSSNGDAVFRAVDHPQFGVNCTNGSLEHTSRHSQALEEAGCNFVEVPVRLRTWRDFAEREGVAYVDLLVLDVEGHELSVIEGMRGSSVLPDVICIEVGHLSFDAIRGALATLGYAYDISSHVNAFFVRVDRLPLFAMRRAVHASAAEPPTVDEAPSARLEELERAKSRALALEDELTASRARVQAIESENAVLRRQFDDAQGLLNDILRSKAWRLIEAYRRLRYGTPAS
ncbi:MAG: FkbM family methyltransferase [Cupriavidus necator]